ncbi:MAG: hypothetical protein RLW68_00835 [Devosia marina]|uniref:hypothetical protein n=1 Tax=Devosia marina TaxID=2683198 RepID=UPI0032EC7E75
MSGVEALEQTTPTPVDTGSPQATETAPDTSVNLDNELEGIWDRGYVTNGADRGEGGKFTSRNAEGQDTAQADGNSDQQAQDAASLEGETAGEQAGSTPATASLPPNWQGKPELAAAWEAIPADKRATIAQHEQELHSRLSDMGRQVSTFKPLQEAASEFSEYFNGNLALNGQQINPADGIRYLANIQRSMDQAPFETLMSIAETYNLQDQLTKHFGGQVQAVPQDQKVLLNEIAELKRTISGLSNPANVEQVIEKRELTSELSRFAQSKPLWAQVEADLPFFITKAKTKLGEAATRTQVLETAYDLAVEADPALRAQTQTAAQAVNNGDSARKAEAAKRAAEVNVTSTSSGKPKQPSLDDELSAIWDKSKRA